MEPTQVNESDALVVPVKGTCPRNRPGDLDHVEKAEGTMGRSHDEFIKYPRTPHLFGSKGTDDDNDALSQKRADAILAQLVEAGVPAADMVAVGRGERDPVVATEDGVEERRNRRVVVTVR